VIPKILGPLLEKPEVPLEVSYAPDLPSTPEELAKADKEKPITDEPVPDPEKRKKDKDKPEAKAPEPATVTPPEVAKVEPPKVPLPKAEPVKPPPVPDKHALFVDQDKFPEEADNTDAHYLAQKNHRTQNETRAKNTNLIRETQSPNEAMSEENQNQSPDVGGKKDKVAELENHQGADKTLPRSSPMQGEEGTSTEPQKPGPLSMRDLTPRSAVRAVEGQRAREGVEQQEQGAGNLPMARIGRDSVRGHAAQKGGQANLRLDHHNYDNIEGFGTAEKERNQAARAESSHKKGRYDKYLAKVAAMRSSIENFNPEVKVGNQTELGTRASPFAGYITAMHRQIHKLFGDGFLGDVEAHYGKTPYDDLTLWTKLEIVVKSDGSVEKVNIVRSSGVTGFDVAAIDSVMSAAPFPSPPKEIRSANGRVYLHWQFHRDETACSPIYADPFILTTPPSEPQDNADAVSHVPSEAPRKLKREKNEDETVAVAHPAAEVVVPEVTAEVRSAAEGWFAAYTRGSVSWLAGWSATPFTAGGEVVAKDGDKLKVIYKQLVAEAPPQRAVTGFEVLTPAGIRGKLGGLPPGGQEKDMLFAVGKAGSEEFILLLKKSSQGWRVCGIDR
jgi:TonB family protein